MKKEQMILVKEISIMLVEIILGVALIIFGIYTMIEMARCGMLWTTDFRQGLGYTFIGLIGLRYILRTPTEKESVIVEEKESI
jgi:hypothetical protein